MEADLVLTNADIVSMDDGDQRYGAAAIHDGKLISLGTDREVERFTGNGTIAIDLKGKTVVPGFIDAHQHMISTGFNLRNVDCRVTSIKEMVEAVRKRAETCASGEWILGWGYDESLFVEKRHPMKADFQGIDNPVLITHYSLHSAIANDAALKATGISGATQVEHGKIEVDHKGEPTGRLIEEALDIVKNNMPPYSAEQMKEALRLADHEYVKYGLTSVHEAGMGHLTKSLDEFKAFQEMVRDKQLKVRVYGMVLDEFFPEAQKMKLAFGFGNDRFKIGAVKMFIDGTLSGKTAAVSQPYQNDGGYGEMNHTDEELKKAVLEAHREGYQVACHAIGDEAVRQVLDAYENALNRVPRKDARHRVEHASVTDRTLRKRMSELGVIPVPQPVFVYFAGDVYQENLHPGQLEGVFAHRSFLNDGLSPAGSSDSPIRPASPLLGMYAAVSRKTVSGMTLAPEEKISLYEALQMYTRNAAYASFDEDRKGTLEVGKLADMTVLPQGFLDFSPEEVKKAEVEMTIIGGEVVYQKEIAP
jgi:hypothetical protein